MEKLANKPAELSFVQAAALPTAYATSYQSLVRNGLQEGDKLLIIGASGGCGSAGVQLASALGAGEVVGVCSGQNEAMVLEQGAHRVVDYTKESFADVFSEHFDMVYDTATASGAGENYFKASEKVLKKGGMHVTINGGAGTWLRKLLHLEGSKFKLMLTDQNGSDLAQVAELLRKSGKVPLVDSVSPFTAEGVEEAFAKLKSRRAKGKIVVEMSDGERI